MALSESEKRYWRGYFERKAAAKQEKETSHEVVDYLRKELSQMRTQLKKWEDDHRRQQSQREDCGSGIMPFVVGCVLGLFIGG